MPFSSMLVLVEHRGVCPSFKFCSQAKFVYQLFDKALYNEQEYFIFGCRTSGYFDLRRLDGTKISALVSYKKLRLLERVSIFLRERRKSHSFL